MEREEREQMRAELVHVRSTTEKDLASAKKQANEAKASSTELEQEKSKLAEERETLRLELDGVRVALADRTAAEESAKKKTTELEERLEAGRSEARASEDKLGELGRDVQAARAKVDVLEKKLEGEARLRKAAEDERNAAKATLTTTLESNQRAADANAKELQALRDASAVVEAELERTKEGAAKAQEELAAERSKVQTPASSAGGVLGAIDADPILNRGQKETIRMTYNQFTSKRRTS
jgi:chromosome segregation ATPase